MLSFFEFCFSCCIKRDSSEQAKDGERRPLLVDNDGAPIYTPRDNLINDRQRIKDKLSGIVQDKQGKMINIADHSLSNLNQRDIPSTSTSRLRATSPSPHPSIQTQETETTSSSSAKVSGDHLLLPKALALNVRLIRGRENSYRGNHSRGRLGKFGEERGIEIHHTTEDIEPERERPLNSPNTKNILNTEEQNSEIQPLNDEDSRAILHISDVVKRQFEEGWKIEDSGPISRGWGD